MRRPLRLPLVLALAVTAGCAGVMVGDPPRRVHPLARTRFETRSLVVSMGTLKQLVVLQQTHRAQFGAYARTLDELKRIGWEAGETGEMVPRIVHHGRRLCVAMLPRVRSLPAWSMGTDSRLHRGAFCGRPG